MTPAPARTYGGFRSRPVLVHHRAHSCRWQRGRGHTQTATFQHESPTGADPEEPNPMIKPGAAQALFRSAQVSFVARKKICKMQALLHDNQRIVLFPTPCLCTKTVLLQACSARKIRCFFANASVSGGVWPAAWETRPRERVTEDGHLALAQLRQLAIMARAHTVADSNSATSTSSKEALPHVVS